MNGQLDKIRKLLAMAESANQVEAEAFTARAAELIAKYGVDRALLAIKEPTSDRPADRLVTVLSPYSHDKVTLLTHIATALRCQAITLISSYSRRSMTVHLFGFESDLDRVDMLFTSLLVQQAQALAAAAYKRSFMAGYSSVVYQRLLDAESHAAKASQSDTGPSVALVLADRSALVKHRVSEKYPHLTVIRRSYSGNGRGAGAKAGRTADLGAGNRLGAQSQGELS